MEDGTRSEPAPINAFMKSPSAIIGHGDTMVLPDVPATIFEGEAEMARRHRQARQPCQRRRRDELRLRLHQLHRRLGARPGAAGNTFYQMKSRDTFAPIGPYIVTADEIRDPQKLQIRLSDNGAVMQNFNTDDMAHKIPRCIEWVTVDPHAGAGRHPRHRHQPSRAQPVHGRRQDRARDRGAGPARFNIKDELKRTWARKTRLQMHEEAAQKTPGQLPGISRRILTGKYAKA